MKMKTINHLYRWSGMIMAILLLFSTTITFAQETSGSLTGRVVDGDGKPMPGASIEALHTPSGTKYNLSTDNDGRFTINNMRIGGPYI